jgi:predicted kinase
MQAVIFIGIQGAGKSTFYRERFFDTHVRISLDVLKTRRREQILFQACLAAQQSFVIDNTNPLASDRARYIGKARLAGFRVISYFFETPLAEAMRRNNLRKLKQKVPAVAVAGTFKKLERPALEEGFDEIHSVTLTPENRFIVA